MWFEVPRSDPRRSVSGTLRSCLASRGFVWRWPVQRAKLDCCESRAAPAFGPSHCPVLSWEGFPHLLGSLFRCHLPSKGFSDYLNLYSHLPSLLYFSHSYLSPFDTLWILPGFCFMGGVCLLLLECGLLEGMGSVLFFVVSSVPRTVHGT